MVEKRNVGIDLLRCVLMFMVCMLHTLGQGGILNSCEVGSLQYGWFYFLEIASYCAVNGFALISGYVGLERKYKYSQIINMWFQVVFYTFVVSIVLNLFDFGTFTISGAISNLMPIINGKFWYFTAYFMLFWFIPLINSYINKISDKEGSVIFCALIAMFSFMGLKRDLFFLNGGYSGLWLVVLYCLGGLMKKLRLFEKKKSIILWLGFMISVMVSWAMLFFKGSMKLVSYTSPTILLTGMLLLAIFSKLQIKEKYHGKILKMGKLMLGVYLLQNNHIIWNHIIVNCAKFSLNYNIIISTLIIFLIASSIFVVGALVEYIRAFLHKTLKVNELSEKIANLLEKICEKLVKIIA